jgi:hypothetical protein
MIMHSIQKGFPFFVCILLLILFLVSSAAAGSPGSYDRAVMYPSGTSSGIDSLFGHPSPAAPHRGPVSAQYLPPPGIMPVIVLTGSPYEMGYQYGLQVPEYIAIVRDAAWASALSRNTREEILNNCSISRQYITTELTGFDFPAFFDGISDAMNDQGISFSPVDPLVMLYYGGRQGPGPEEHCTSFAAFGNTTNGKTIVAENFDYFEIPANSYAVLLALYPDKGHAAIVPSGAGRTGSGAVINDQGLVYIVTSAPSQGPGDSGPGITGFLELPYVGMTAGSVDEARQFLLNSTRAFALNHMLADESGNAEVIEATRSRYAIRYPGDTGNSGYIIATNHYLNTAMKSSQRIWDPLQYNPSSYYRYITADKELTDHSGNVDYTTARDILSMTDWWDGKEWHRDGPFSTNTINHFRPDAATLYSFIAVPGDGVVSICSGNPGMPYWGTRASGQTGTYVNYTVGKTPAAMVYQLRSDADAILWKTMQVMGKHPDSEVTRLYAASEDRYWEAVWWHNRGLLETDSTARAVAFGRAATGFSEVIAWSEQIQSLCSTGQC